MAHRNARSVVAAGRQQARRAWFRVEKKFNRLPTVAHQGIQRSGTNYLGKLLDQAGFFVINRVDPPRDDPRHKHFRWQPDKSTIVISPAYRNGLTASTVLDINRICGWDGDEKHIVIFKEPAAWLSSIHRWGLAHGWVDPGVDFFGDRKLAAGWLQEWSAYYQVWADMHAGTPAQVYIVCYEDLVAEPERRIRDIATFLGVSSRVNLRDGGRVAKVPHSSVRQTSSAWMSMGEDDRIHELVERTVSFDWRAFRP